MNVAIIAGSGFDSSGLSPLDVDVETPWGSASARPLAASDGTLVLPRHGQPHRLAPHAINYRANLWLLHGLGVDRVIALNTVGGIAPRPEPGGLVVPRQLIDYTWGRDSTFSDDERLLHVDFTEPYDAELRAVLLAAAEGTAHDGGIYACTAGPRLETAAEIDRLERDGATIVGMTGMPEAVLARELEMRYAALCLVVNPAAGRAPGPIDHAKMFAVLERGQNRMFSVALRAADSLARHH